MKQTIENFIGTRWWIPQLIGNWTEDQVDLYQKHKPEFTFPKDVKAQIESKWEESLRGVGAEIGAENIDWKLSPDKPYQKMEIPDGNGVWKLRMFAGPQTRIENYQSLSSKRLGLIHSQTNYAESMATNNANLYELISQYKGRNALADGHAVSIAILGRNDKDQKVMQFFKRGAGLGEYGSYIGTAAGNSHLVEKNPFTIAKMEAREESGIVSLEELPFKEREILNKEISMISYQNKKGNTESGYLVSENAFRLLGLTLNIDADDRNTIGERKPHHKSEYLFIADTGLPVELLNKEPHGWRRSDEHADVMYVPLKLDNLMDMALTYAPGADGERMMPPTQALTMNVIRDQFGNEAYQKGIEAINAKYPIFEDQPFFDAVKKGDYKLPNLILQK